MAKKTGVNKINGFAKFSLREPLLTYNFCKYDLVNCQFQEVLMGLAEQKHGQTGSSPLRSVCNSAHKNSLRTNTTICVVLDETSWPGHWLHSITFWFRLMPCTGGMFQKCETVDKQQTKGNAAAVASKGLRGVHPRQQQLPGCRALPPLQQQQHQLGRQQ